ncbi:unnamed protein product [Didymodactylos carnosus]|uniref:TRAF1-6 MATH domain-containing protein n=1 Tax=Didymodactylos carnosus TaxID=1234261 RepID=A0A815XA16_9BILA|nr:unnamed protein product [Didymodactylos carnosus]CAF4416014.1 unnamed protein product [Didymodactylos carnosus]
MCMRLYLNGEYDAVLKWPFHFKITFCLFDQSGQKRHIIDSFNPDTKSNSFQLPTAQMNIASGIPKFFPLAVLQQEEDNYVKDDTMFIKCIVNFNDFSTMMLPYLLSLNPGLPNHVQERMIENELQRRQQQQQNQSVITTTIPVSSPCT